MTDYAKPPRAPRHWDAEAKALFASWKSDALAAYMTELDWTALVRVISSDQTRRERGELRADLLRVIDNELTRIRKVALERKVADEAAPDPTPGLPPGIAEHSHHLGIAAWLYPDEWDDYMAQAHPDLHAVKHKRGRRGRSDTTRRSPQ